MDELNAHEPLLDILRKEYDYEVERKKQFESKAGNFVGFTLAAVPFFVGSKVDVFRTSISAIKSEVYSYSGVWAVLHMLVFFLGSIFIVYALYQFLCVYSRFSKYEHLPISELIELAIADGTSFRFNMHVAVLIERAISHNQVLIDDKSERLTKGIFWLVLGVITWLIWSIIYFLAGF